MAEVIISATTAGVGLVFAVGVFAAIWHSDGHL
jgi:hypothetical protein